MNSVRKLLKVKIHTNVYVVYDEVDKIELQKSIVFSQVNNWQNKCLTENLKQELQEK